MRMTKGRRTLAEILLDNRVQDGMLESEAINKYRDRLVQAQGDLNQGKTSESEKGSTGQVGQDKKDLEDDEDENEKPGPAHDE